MANISQKLQIANCYEWCNLSVDVYEYSRPMRKLVNTTLSTTFIDKFITYTVKVVEPTNGNRPT